MTEETEQSSEEYSEVELSGKAYKVPAAFLNALKTRDEQVINHITALTEELQKKQEARVERTGAPMPEEIDWGAEFDADPKEAARKLRAELRAEVLAEARADRDVQSRQDQFWGEFYKNNSELEGYDHIVRSVLQANINSLGRMDVKTGMAKLADKVWEQVEGLSIKRGKRKSEDEDSNVSSIFESSGLSVMNVRKKPEREEESSLAAAMQQRNKRRGR